MIHRVISKKLFLNHFIICGWELHQINSFTVTAEVPLCLFFRCFSAQVLWLYSLWHEVLWECTLFRWTRDSLPCMLTILIQHVWLRGEPVVLPIRWVMLDCTHPTYRQNTQMKTIFCYKKITLVCYNTANTN